VAAEDLFGDAEFGEIFGALTEAALDDIGKHFAETWRSPKKRASANSASGGTLFVLRIAQHTYNGFSVHDNSVFCVII
jgi:hypothetical protein